MSINIVTISGKISRPPKKVQGNYIFPLAVRDGNSIVFPVVILENLPPFVSYQTGKKLHEQPLVTVVGRVRTRNVTRPLATELAILAQRAGATQDLINAVEDLLNVLNLESKRVVTEILVEKIMEGGTW